MNISYGLKNEKMHELHLLYQPIVSNNVGGCEKSLRWEVLSRGNSASNIEFFFKYHPRRISDAALKQVEILTKKTRPLNVCYHINIHISTLFNFSFMYEIERLLYSGVKVAFEMDYFYISKKNIERVTSVFNHLNIIGAEVWFDDCTTSERDINLLMTLPWDGIKIDKTITWSGSANNLLYLVALCKKKQTKVIVEGVESNYLFKLSIKSGAEFSQGFLWESIHSTPERYYCL
ncbi:MAG: EAL domain-containing protein [Vibrio sp.]